MFAEDVVPDSCQQLAGLTMDGEKYHSVSALGSSIGTAILWSPGAAILTTWQCWAC